MDVISQAFQWDCDLVLQKVFLYLDPHSLKSSRQVRGETETTNSHPRPGLISGVPRVE